MIKYCATAKTGEVVPENCIVKMIEPKHENHRYILPQKINGVKEMNKKKTITIDSKLWQEADIASIKAGMNLSTVNGWIVKAIKEKLEKEGKGNDVQ
uniref:Uncharacterized protein n=1 Tax=viral metagenome TaxID=1070528 RepID=A0A6M3LDX5_9ZZZZ